MTQDEQPVYHLALRDLHSAAGAAFAVHEGWLLPEHYGRPELEHEALRSSAGILERSHRSRILVSGTDAEDVLAAVFAGEVSQLEEGRALRAVALDGAGKISDLVLVARTGAIAYLVSGEAGRRLDTLERLQRAVGGDYDVRIEDRTASTCLLGLAGPRAAEVASTHLSEALPSRLRAMDCVTFEFHGFRALAIRTSDTGEDGFEFMLAPAVARHVIETLGRAGVTLAGHAAENVARVEACIPAFEPDLSPGLSPAEADLDVMLGIPGGRDDRMLAALLIEAEAPPAVGAIIRSETADVGSMRSCVRSPQLNATIGFGIIESREALPGRELDVAGCKAVVVAKPFLRRRHHA